MNLLKSLINWMEIYVYGNIGNEFVFSTDTGRIYKNRGSEDDDMAVKRAGKYRY